MFSSDGFGSADLVIQDFEEGLVIFNHTMCGTKYVIFHNVSGLDSVCPYALEIARRIGAVSGGVLPPYLVCGDG